MFRSPFLERPEKLSHLESRSKLSNLRFHSFFSHILDRRRGSLHTRSFRRICFSDFRYRCTKMALWARNVSGAVMARNPVSPGFSRNGLQLGHRVIYVRPYVLLDIPELSE